MPFFHKPHDSKDKKMGPVVWPSRTARRLESDERALELSCGYGLLVWGNTAEAI